MTNTEMRLATNTFLEKTIVGKCVFGIFVQQMLLENKGLYDCTDSNKKARELARL